MKTDDLIAALAADAAAPRPRRTVHLGLLPVLGAVLAVIAVLTGLGVRADIATAATGWRFLLKIALALTLAGLALWQVLGLYRPEFRPRPLVLLPVLAGLGGAVLAELLLLPADAWRPRLVGGTAAVCVVAIPLLALAPLAALLHALRRGAPSSPTAAGTMAGIAAAAIAISAYALHCIEDSPLFVAVWYTLGALIVVALGALLGRLLLRW